MKQERIAGVDPLRITRSISVVAKLAKSFGARAFRKSWRLPLRGNRTVIDRTFLNNTRLAHVDALESHFQCFNIRCNLESCWAIDQPVVD